MTGYQSKKAAAQDKMGEALTLEALKYAASKGYGRILREMKIAPFAIKSDEALAQPAQEPESECNPQDLCAGCRCKYVAQPEQERTDYAVHLNHCNIGECQGVCKYLDDDCPALKHADMKAKWDSPATQQPAQEPVAWIQKDMQCDDFDPDSVTCEKPNIGADGWEWIPLYTSPPQRKPLTIEYQSGYYDGKKAALAGREWNFCERCGKRTADLTVIHTCTPPQENT